MFLIVLLMYKLLHFRLVLTKMFQFDSLGNNIRCVLVSVFDYNFNNITNEYYFNDEDKY